MRLEFLAGYAINVEGAFEIEEIGNFIIFRDEENNFLAAYRSGNIKSIHIIKEEIDERSNC